MNWNKILLITGWAALITVIGAAAGYTVLGPTVPLPYQYVETDSLDTPQEDTLDSEHSPENEHVGEDSEQPDNQAAPTEETTESASDEAADPQAAPSTEVTNTTVPAPDTTAPSPEDMAGESEQAGAIEEETAPENYGENPEEDHGNDQPSDSENAVDASDASSTTEQSNEDNEGPSKAASVEPETTPTPSESINEDHAAKAPQVAPPEIAALPDTTPLTSPVFSSEPSWKLYGQKVAPADGRPRIAIVLTGLGLSRAATEAAIRQLPKEITLSFTPYARNLESWIALARSMNHEILLDLPMEPITYPADDPGPQALLTGRQPEGNLNNLAWIAHRGSGYIGMSAYMGDRFMTSERQMGPVMEYFKDHGLLFLDNGRNEASLAKSLGDSLGVPVLINQRAIDEAQLSRQAIDSRLAQVESIALKNGFAIATGRPFPVTLERIAKWVSDLEQKGYQLVPLTAVLADDFSVSPDDTTGSKSENKANDENG